MNALAGQEVQWNIAIFIAYEGIFLTTLPVPPQDAAGEDLCGLGGALCVGEAVDG